ncbi:coiled-coil domain-containing protein 50 isoform X2 [Poeciliopsis prolifica]|uniref:coiled-coil domain-containing protein 50 isoform X2 n=1 Tax=Poeciliopsis prolifica TaxID=188132 RepID=UPI002413A1CB|nr:coiled-coil domain-containing protein 50 isoform X2 [Poeciliopsis prolifica]
MAECNVSIDQKKLPGVKEVCKDFAVLEDHSLAYNLQEQEIESHLASNVHKNRLVQKDLQVAKKLQEEEDEIAKIQNQKQNSYIERQDVEIAQEIQEELVRQAEQQRQQEEKDAAIARKLHEKEMMKEERRRQKQMEAKYEEDYFEDHGEPRSADVDKRTRQTSRSPDLHGHVDKGSSSVIPETEYGLPEATKGLTNLDLREQELKDMEVARRLQEEELKRMSNMQERAAQVAKDEEIARLLMEKEKKEYRKNREREKEKERERMAMEKMAIERKRPEGNYKPGSEEAAWPRTREEYEYHRQRNNNRPVRPPQPRTPDYENVSSVHVYSDHHAASRPPQRPEAAYRGAYQKR